MTDRTITLVEASPRDGLQNEKTLVSTADKIALIERAIAAGFTRIEATSFVNPKRVPQMADAEAVMAGVPRIAGVRYSGLALNERGFERAVAAGCHEVTYVLVASETFNQRNNGVPRAETMAGWRRVASAAKAAGVKRALSIATAFGCPFEGEMPAQAVLAMLEEALAEEPDEMSFADTIGCGVPVQVEALAAGAKKLSPKTPLRFHFHNTRGTGVANVVAAVRSGATILDACVAGVGGCPFAPAATGNVATEDVIYTLHRMGYETGLDAKKIIDAAQWLSGVIGKPPQSAVAKAGWFPS